MAEIANNSIDIQVVETGGENAQYFWHNTTDSGAGEGAGAHVTQIPKADFVADPENGGANTLIRSNGMSIRNGTNVRAHFGNNDIILYSADDVPAFTVRSGSGSSSQTIVNIIGQEVYLPKGSNVTKSYTAIDNVPSGSAFEIDVENIHDVFIATIAFTKGTASVQTFTFTFNDGYGDYTATFTASYNGAKQIIWKFTSISPDMGDITSFYINVATVSYTDTVNDTEVEISGETIWKNPDDVFVVEHYTHSYSTVSSGNGMDWSESVTKAGYYPVGVVGFATNRAALVVDRCRLQDVTVGSCTIQMNARAVASASASTADMYVLWVKAE